MTTEEIIKFIRAHIKVEDLKPCFGTEKYLKGYITGLITMASVQQNITLQTQNELLAELAELDAAIMQAQELATKNTDKSDT